MRIKILILIAGFAAILLGVKACSDTLGDPVVQRAYITSTELSADEPPITIALISDIHVAGPDMPPSRLEDIVAQINALEPDVVAIAGDLVSEKRVSTRAYSAKEIVAPLAGLRPRYGTIVVAGNHDHWFDWAALEEELLSIDNVTVLTNNATQIGPLAIAGVDDDFTGRADMIRAAEQTYGMSGPRIALSHSPDVFPQVPTNFDLVLAGHTHCGQIGYPWGGAPGMMSDYGDLYACGLYEKHGKTLVTTAGLGTSLIPIRLFTQPEIWLIEISGE